MRKVCFYHAGCPDGFGAAWAAWCAWGDSAVYTPITHDDEIDSENHAGDLVAFVDIVPPNENLAELGRVADHIVVLDHHRTALDRYQSDLQTVNAMEEAGHQIHFDLSHSGAFLSWQYFRGDEPPPELLLYIEDRDLWSWKLPRSEQVNAAVDSYRRRFDVWSDLATRSFESLADEGEPIVRSKRVEVQRCLHHAHPAVIGGRRVSAVNSTYERAAIGHELAIQATYGDAWGCLYRISGRTVFITLYSVGDFDVSAIAAAHGGGGHPNAAGFSVSLERWLKEML